jgi:hypothetical protein
VLLCEPVCRDDTTRQLYSHNPLSVSFICSDASMVDIAFVLTILARGLSWGAMLGTLYNQGGSTCRSFLTECPCLANLQSGRAELAIPV